MDDAIPAHAIAGALRPPCHSHQGNSVPSLILRLELLPEAMARRERARSLAAAPDQPAEPEGPAQTAPDTDQDQAGPPHRTVADVVAEATRAGEAPTPLFEHRPQSPASVRRIVDVAAPERLTVATPLTRWSAAVAASHDPCFVLDSNGILISISVAAAELLGCGDSAVIGRHLLDVITLVDLDTGSADPDYATRITALAVLESPGLSRSLIRVRHEDNALVTLDMSSAPVHDVTGYTLGSVTFLAPIPRR